MMMMRAKMMKAIMMMVRLNKEIKVLLWLLLSLVDNHHDDIYIMMKCVFVCLSRKMSTSSWEALVIT